MSIINGIATLADGFSKPPPPQEVCQSRANVCLFSGPPDEHIGTPTKCPFNHRGAISVTTAIAAAIHAARQRKLELNLRVEGEEGLGVCKLCGCDLKTKVFWDAESIYSHTTDSTFERFRSEWPKCWMNQLQPNQ